MSIISSTSHSASSTATLSQRLTAAIGASILSACLVYFAGFSHIEAVHNAAHDTRHSAAFRAIESCRHDQAYCANRRVHWAVGGLAADSVAKLLGRPLILQAESFEKARQPPKWCMSTPLALLHTATMPKPGAEDGWQRVLSTTGGNLVVAVGFALMLAGLYTLRAPTRTAQGLLWGLAGYATFVLAPPWACPGTARYRGR